MRKIFFSILFTILFATPVYAQEPVLQVLNGQTVIEDMTHPNNAEIAEAEKYLSDNHVDIPVEIEELCDKYGKMNNIAPELLEAIIWKESRFKAEVVDATGTCKGLMQVRPSSHSKRMERLGVKDIFDIESNIKVGADYLRELLEDNDLETAIMLYNGDKRAYEEGYRSSYVKKVLEVSQALERRHFK